MKCSLAHSYEWLLVKKPLNPAFLSVAGRQAIENSAPLSFFPPPSFWQVSQNIRTACKEGHCSATCVAKVVVVGVATPA